MASTTQQVLFLGALAAAYRETKGEEYAQTARDYIGDWINTHPSRNDWKIETYDNVLNLCIRMGNSQWPGWLGTLPVFSGSTAYDDVFVSALISSACTQLNYLRGHMAAAGNWRIANADSLLVCGILLEPLPLAETVRSFAIEILNDAFSRQVLSDGVHVERTPGYHYWMMKVMTRYWELSRVMPELGLVIDTKTLARMYDYALLSLAPNGAWNALHDCQNIVYGYYEMPNIMDERSAFLRKAGLPEKLPQTSQYFPCAGQALLRSDWELEADYLTFDATLSDSFLAP